MLSSLRLFSLLRGLILCLGALSCPSYAENPEVDHHIDHQTVKTSPQDRTRLKVGVGEEVTLTLVPGHLANWAITSGTGKIDGAQSVSGKSSVTFKAPNTTPQAQPATNPPTYEEESTTIKATCTQDSGTAEITIKTIRPSGVKMYWKSAIANNAGPLEVSYQADIFILPADVNFEAIQVYESTDTATVTGFFQKFSGFAGFMDHPATSAPGAVAVTSHREGIGSKVANPDTISCPTQAPTASPPIPPVAAGSYTSGDHIWDIPTGYKLGGDQGIFTIVQQVSNLRPIPGATPNYFLKVSKAGSYAVWDETAQGDHSPPLPPE